MQKFDVAIIGAGPAGLFAAWELAGSKLKVAVIDEGREPMARNPAKTPSDSIFGVGGAGAYSDGKLNLTHEIGGSPEDLKRSGSDVQKMIDSVDSTLMKFGIPKECSGVNGADLEELKRKANKEGIEFVSGKQKHIGTDEVRKVIDRFYQALKKKGISFLLETKVKKIKRKGNSFELETANGGIECSHLICAPGRGNAYWLREELKKIGAITRYGPIDVGEAGEAPGSASTNPRSSPH
ncbi:MAG: FAD-dependent oxidoreductase [Candidatus Diapherotrites archaeon]|nr:FAD-dependent oxidoreductase [Candidatus Diapherotrites archaeon]